MTNLRITHYERNDQDIFITVQDIQEKSFKRYRYRDNTWNEMIRRLNNKGHRIDHRIVPVDKLLSDDLSWLGGRMINKFHMEQLENE